MYQPTVFVGPTSSTEHLPYAVETCDPVRIGPDINMPDSESEYDEFRIPEGWFIFLYPVEIFKLTESNLFIERKLGVFSTALLIINRMVGTGIFTTPAAVIRSTNSVGAALLFWVLGGILTLAGLFVYLEYGTALPRSGGEKIYLERVYRKPAYLATCIFAVQFVLFAVSTGNCISFSSYILYAATDDTHERSKLSRGIAVAVMTFVSLVHAFLPRTGIYISNALGAFKLVLLLLVICCGFAALAGHRATPDPHNFSSFNGGTNGDSSVSVAASASASGYATALLQVLYSYGGWENANYVLTEVRQPARTLKRAAPIAALAVMLLYVLANIAYFSVFSKDRMATLEVTLSATFFEDIFHKNTFSSKVMPVLVALSALGNVFAQTFAMPRVKQELAKQGILPASRFWSSDWPFRAPSAAIFLHWIFSVILIVSLTAKDSYTFVTNIFTYTGNWIKRNFNQVLLAIGLLYLTWTPSEDWARTRTSFRNYPPVTVFYALSLLFTLAVPFVPNDLLGSIPFWVLPTVGTSMLAVGALYWLIWANVLPMLGFHMQHEIEVMQDGSERVRYH
ncbi:hypothetical protein TD95_001846, partial [Thielaviopsis punctulata]